MNRRCFLKSASATLLSAPVLLSMEGCNESAENVLNTVLEAASSIISVADQGAPWLSAFNNAVQALEGAESAWKAGSPVDVVISALNTLAAVTAVIPVTAAYSPLIDVLVAGIDSVLGLLVPSASARFRLRTTPNPHQGRVALRKPHLFQTRVGAFKEQYNATAVQCGFPQAKIR